MGDLVVFWVCFTVRRERERERDRKVTDGGERGRVGDREERDGRK
jgi:hypothetical protein